MTGYTKRACYENEYVTSLSRTIINLEQHSPSSAPLTHSALVLSWLADVCKAHHPLIIMLSREAEGRSGPKALAGFLDEMCLSRETCPQGVPSQLESHFQGQSEEHHHSRRSNSEPDMPSAKDHGYMSGPICLSQRGVSSFRTRKT